MQASLCKPLSTFGLAIDRRRASRRAAKLDPQTSLLTTSSTDDRLGVLQQSTLDKRRSLWLDNMSGVKYSLAPTARCPFGWPAVPNYPIDASPPSLASRRTSGTDDDVVMTDGTAAVDGLQDPVSLHGDDGEGVAEDETLEEELSRRYLEALFDDGNAQTRVRSVLCCRRLER